MSADKKTIHGVVETLSGVENKHPLTRPECSKDKLVTDLKAVVADAEMLIREAADSSAEAFDSLRAGIQLRLVTAKKRLAGAQESISANSRRAGASTRAYVSGNPWKSAGMLAAAGVLVGAWLARRQTRSSPSANDHE